MGEKKRIAWNMLANIFVFFINLLISFILTPYVTAHVGKEVYGFVSLAFQFTGYMSLIMTALNGMAGRFMLIEYSKGNYEKASSYFSSVIIGNAIFSVVVFVPSIVLIAFLDVFLKVPVEHLNDIKLLWAFIFANFIFSMAFNVYGNATYIANRLDLSAMRSLENKVLYAIILFICFSLFDAKVWFIGFANFLCGFYLIFTNIYYTRKLTSNLHFNKKLASMDAAWDLIKAGIWNMIQQMAYILINGCDMVISNIYINSMSMTLMGFAKTIPVYIMSIIGIVCGAFAPQMTMIYAKGDMKEFTTYTKSAIKVCGFICSVPILGFIVFGTNFFQLWLPTLDAPEIMVVQILSIMILTQTVFDVYIYPLYTVNQITTRLKVPVLVSLGIGVVNIWGSIILCRYTDLGVFAIQIVSSILLTARVFFFAPIWAAYTLKQKWYTFYGSLFRGTFSSIILLLLFGTIRYFIDIHSWLGLIIIAIPCGFLGYVVNYFIVLSKCDRKLLREIIKRKLRKS